MHSGTTGRLIFNKTRFDLQMFNQYFLAYPETQQLPEEIADLFEVTLHQGADKLHIIVDMAPD